MVLLVSSDLSSYTPKHSVEFNAWQEHKLDESAHREEDTSQSTEGVMVKQNKTKYIYSLKLIENVTGPCSCKTRCTVFSIWHCLLVSALCGFLSRDLNFL